jgi:hypothetical protein
MLNVIGLSRTALILKFSGRKVGIFLVLAAALMAVTFQLVPARDASPFGNRTRYGTLTSGLPPGPSPAPQLAPQVPAGRTVGGGSARQRVGKWL